MDGEKPSVSRFEGDDPPSYSSDSKEHTYESLQGDTRPIKRTPNQKPAVLANTAANSKFRSSMEGGAKDDFKPDPVVTQPMDLDDPKDIDRSGYVAVVVSGIRFVSPKEPILSHAGTRLGQAVASASFAGPPMLQMSGVDAASDIASDAKAMKADHPTESPLVDTSVVEFYCDRNPIIFPHILQYYRTGTLHLPHSLCWDFVKDELDFWEIQRSAIPECCMNPIRVNERHLNSTRLVQSLFFAEKINTKKMDEGIFRQGSLYQFLYEVEGSLFSILYFYFYMILALLFAISYILQLNDFFRVGHPPTEETNTTHCVRYEPEYPGSSVKMYFMTHPHPVLRWFDMFCVAVFSIDLLLRFISYPSKVLFMCNTPNLIELICLAGNYFSLTLTEISIGHFWCSIPLLKGYLAIEVLRVFRLTRIPFFSPRYSWMRVLLLTLKRGFSELLLLIGLVFILVMFFGYLIIIPEMYGSMHVTDAKTIEANIYLPHIGMWWAIVTMATVGYGDFYPITAAGYCIGSVCAVTGVLFLSLQVPLISSRFNLLYQYAKQESNKLDEIKRQKSENRRQIVEEERMRRERFWQRQFRRDEAWEEAFRSGNQAEDTLTTTDYSDSLPDRSRIQTGISNPVG